MDYCSGEIERFQSTTLFSRQRPFQWSYNAKNGICIFRTFRNCPVVNHFSIEDIEKIIDYVRNYQPVTLANNVQRLHDNTEGPGLGYFVFYGLNRRNPSDSMAMSHIAAIMVEVGAFKMVKVPRTRGFVLSEDVTDWKVKFFGR